MYVVRGSSCILVVVSDDVAVSWWSGCGGSGVCGDGGSVTSFDLWSGVCWMFVCLCWTGVSLIVCAVAARACPGMIWKTRSDCRCASVSASVVWRTWCVCHVIVWRTSGSPNMFGCVRRNPIVSIST